MMSEAYPSTARNRINLVYFNAMDFSERRSEEVMLLLTLSVVGKSSRGKNKFALT